MGKIKIGLIIFGLIAVVGLVVGGIIFAQNPLEEKIIALDAGHGGTETGGAVNQKYQVAEADVNWDVVQALKIKLEEQKAYVVVADRLSTRRDRVNDAVAKCAALDVNGDGVADNKKCDVLVSVHHNGSSDPTHDGTLTIYTQNSDKPLAEALLNSLVPLTGRSEGMLKGGYGMTVYKNLVSAITEAYYITNDWEAEQYYYSVDKDGNGIIDRIEEEADALLQGLSDYFSIPPTKPGRK